MLEKEIQEACHSWPIGLGDMVSSLKGLEVGHLVQPSVDPAVVSASLAQFDIQRFCSLFVDDVAKPIRLILSYVEKQLKLLADSVKAVRSEILSKKPVASTISSEKEQLLRRLRTLYSLIQLFSPSPPASASGIVAIGMPDSSNEDLLSTSPPLSDSSTTSSSSTRVNCMVSFSLSLSLSWILFEVFVLFSFFFELILIFFLFV